MKGKVSGKITVEKKTINLLNLLTLNIIKILKN